jgi:hypothetical protein
MKSDEFTHGFSSALQGAEAIIWAMEDDAFLYDTVSDAMQAVIGELQDMERKWTGQVSMVHRSELLAKIKAQEAEIQRLREGLLAICQETTDSFVHDYAAELLEDD